MKTRATAMRLYAACGFKPKPSLVHRMVGADASELGEFVAQMENQVGDFREHDDIEFERKMFRARSAARLIAWLPFVRAVAVCNSLGFHMTHEASDVDLFIVAAAGRVWSARWYVTGVLALLRMRPGEAHRDPVCVSFFVDERVSSLDDLMIERDVYFFYWLRTLMPIVGNHVLFKDAARLAPEFRVRAHVSRVREFFAGVLSENFVRRQQMRIMPADVLRHEALHNTTVVLSDQIIKLHQNDRREELSSHVFT